LFVLLNIRVDGDIKTHLNEIWREGVDGIHLTQDKILALVFGRHGNKLLRIYNFSQTHLFIIFKLCI